MSLPTSFCTLATENCKDELLGLLLSLACHHRGAPVICLCDDATRDYVERCSTTCPIALQIIWVENLTPYKGKNRAQMEQDGSWTEFQMMKTVAIDEALKLYSDTLFLDSDIIVVNTIDCIDKTKEIGLSPHLIRKADTDRFGYFNGGVLWTRHRKVPEDWREATKTSRYYDQASIEELAKAYSYFEFGPHYNMSWWRIQQADSPPQAVVSQFGINSDRRVTFRGHPLGFIHTHFNRAEEKPFNQLMISMLKQAAPTYFRELSIINRISTGKWTIHVPKQPQPFPWDHTNDSFREALRLLESKHFDIEVRHDHHHNLYLEPDILLYDRDTLDWIEWNFVRDRKIQFGFIGNGTLEDIKTLRSRGLPCVPWTYWPRHPERLEKLIADGLGNKSWQERHVESIFIGNIENRIQGKYRSDRAWEDNLTEYHCTQGKKHKFTQEEYLGKLASARFGLCLRGYGAKCHRAVELMALGTVPLITPEACTDSYMEPLIENVHYLRVQTPEDIPSVIARTDSDAWQRLSAAGREWFNRNVHSDQLWRTFMGRFMRVSFGKSGSASS